MKTRIAFNINNENSVAILNELFARLDCSMARYLSYARPWVQRPNTLLDALVGRMSYEYEIFTRKIARLIYDRRGAVRSCVFPMGFTSYNDLSLEYLAPRLLEQERALIVSAEEYGERLNEDREAEHVVGRIVASLRRYAVLLADLLAPARVAPPTAADEDGVRRGKAPLWTARERFRRPAVESPLEADKQLQTV
jgi:hypothetical protein